MIRSILLWMTIVIVSLEFLLAASFEFPAFSKHLPAGFLSHVRRVYLSYSRRVMQWEPGATQYDPSISYIFTPGRFLFSNSEYRHEVRVNRLGIRDDESSLEAPEVIVVGDSIAMGWGVGQEESFPQRLEQKTGLTVLNASVASYGTVREMRLLDRVDTSRLKYLIIQYCDNDLGENRAFYHAGNRFPVMTKEKYEEIRKRYKWARLYYPGKYTLVTLRFLAKFPRTEEMTREDEAGIFLNALIHGGRLSLEGTQLFVFELNQYGKNDDHYVQSLKEKILHGEYPSFIEKMEVIDFSKLLDPRQHYYILDDHLNAKGHEVVAETLARMLKSK